MTKGNLRWAPFPGGPQKCRLVKAPHSGYVLVRWETGPLAGREGRIHVRGIRQNKRDVPCGENCDDVLCAEHGILS